MCSQQPGAARQAASPPPEAELVSMDFIATGTDGRPVKTLTPDRGGIIPTSPPEPFGSNLLSDAGRIVMLVMNHESISPGRERPARDAAVKFLRSLSPRDRVGLVTVPRGSALVDPTRDHEQVRAALMRISGQAPQTRAAGLPATSAAAGVSSSQTATSDRACMTRLTLENLTGMLDSLSSLEEPKTIVFVSGGLSTPTRDAPTNGRQGRVS